MISNLFSWNDTAIKNTILKFVEAVTSENSLHYVSPEDRVAAFDNDGTLWCEKPAYIQLFFAIERLNQMAALDPSLLEKPAYKAAAEGDLAYFGGLYPADIPALMQIVFDSHAGMPQQEFERLAYDFLTRQQHPRFGVPYKKCVYHPMVELLAFLQANDFKVFVASAGGMSFMRTISEEIYGVPRENVIGSNIRYEYQGTVDGPVLLRKPGLIEPIDDGPGKPVNIELHIGRPPILAAGNADGDIEMLEYTAAENSARGKPFLNLLLCHDDDAREYAYHDGAEKVQRIAIEQNWTCISMKEDFISIIHQ